MLHALRPLLLAVVALQSVFLAVHHASFGAGGESEVYIRLCSSVCVCV
jgi:hypothetical protein